MVLKNRNVPKRKRIEKEKSPRQEILNLDLLLGQDDEVTAALDWSDLPFYMRQYFGSTYISIKTLMKN